MYVIPKAPLKYVLPGVMAHMFNGDAVSSMYDVLRLQHPYWLKEAIKCGDEHIEDMLEDMYGSAREGELNMLTEEDDISVLLYDGERPHTFRPVWVSKYDLCHRVEAVMYSVPEGSVIYEGATTFLERVEELPRYIYKDNETLVAAYLDSGLTIDTSIQAKGGTAYIARLELQEFLSVELKGNLNDYYA
jgi:hypothetical protein